MEWLQTYAVFVIPIAVGVLTQFFKFLIYSFKHGLSWEYAFTHGHMPSAHTALVVSLVTAIGYYEGIHTGVFALSVVIAFIVIDDAARIRMYMGDQGRYLNMLIAQLNIDKENFPRLKERVGHRLNEVLVGAFLGFFLTTIFIHLLESL